MTYLSDAYVNDSQEIPHPFAKPPQVWPMGEIQFEDGVTMLVPQPSASLWQSVPPPEDTLGGGLSFTGVMEAFDKAPQSHAKGRMDGSGVPVWGVALIVLGLALMAFGWLLNDPVSLLIYTAIHGS